MSGLLALSAVFLVTLGAIAVGALSKGRDARAVSGSPTFTPAATKSMPNVIPASAPPMRNATRPINSPTWYIELPEEDRAPYPLPSGIRFGSAARTYVNESDGSELVFVPSGAFTMGTNDGEPLGRPAHEVELSAYFIGKYTVTNAQFARFVQATKYRTFSEREKTTKRGFDFDQESFIGHPVARTWRDPQGEGRVPPGNFPVVDVNWEDAMAYARWAGLTLPTEAQWERAAAWDAKTKRAHRYPWGDTFPGPNEPRISATEEGASSVKVASVGAFPANASSCGAMDMASNILEWCLDGAKTDFVPYPDERVVDPGLPRPEAAFHILRGACPGPATERRFVPTNYYFPHVGFRIALVPLS